MIVFDDGVVFDRRVLSLPPNAELLFWRAVSLAGLLKQKPLRLTMPQFTLLKFGLCEPDGYGNEDFATDDDVKRYVDHLVEAGLVTDVHGDGEDCEFFFAEDLAHHVDDDDDTRRGTDQQSAVDEQQPGAPVLPPSTFSATLHRNGNEGAK